jgi:hypothetical protein
MQRLALVLLLMLVAVPVFGEQSAPNPQSNALLGALRKAEQKNPYGKLFEARRALSQAIAEAPKDSKPRVVCGMLIIPADPSLDPKMLITPPQDPKLEYKIRTIDPPICNSSR